MISKILSLLLLCASSVDGFSVQPSTRSHGSELSAVPEFLSTVDPTVLAGGAAAVLIGIGGAAVAGSMGGGDSSADTPPAAVVEEEVVDVSIDYDSAAKLAYDEWRVANNKGKFDAAGFDVFKEIYVESTVGMVTYKEMKRKMERDLAAQKKSYEAMANKLENLENVGWGQQPQNAI